MIHKQAEESYRQGAMLLEAGQPREALPFFKAAIDMSTEHDLAPSRRTARYVSFYGLCLFRTRSSLRDALNSCRSASQLNPVDPDVWCNLGRVAAAAGRRAEAYRAWRHGLELDSTHGELIRELRRFGIRRRPPLTFLGRSHPLNVALGKVRAALVRRPGR